MADVPSLRNRTAMRRAQVTSMIRPASWCGRTFWFIVAAMGLMLSGALATGVIVVGQRFSLTMGAATLALAVVSAAVASRLITRPFHRLMATLKQAQTDLDQAYVQFVETMAQALDARDPYTAGHSVRVAAYSYAIAREIGLPEEQAETIRIAGQLHDIGKIGIPDVILQKSGKLTPDEFGLVKLHPQIV